mgnify:CR=1 FL=1
MKRAILFLLLVLSSELFSVEYIPPRYELKIYPDGDSNSFSLRVNIKCFVDSSSTRVFVHIPDGMDVLSGDKEKVIELDSGDVYEHTNHFGFLWVVWSCIVLRVKLLSWVFRRGNPICHAPSLRGACVQDYCILGML